MNTTNTYHTLMRSLILYFPRNFETAKESYSRNYQEIYRLTRNIHKTDIECNKRLKGYIRVLQLMEISDVCDNLTGEQQQGKNNYEIR